MDIQYTRMHTEDYDESFALWQSIPGIRLNSADSVESINNYLARNPGQSFVCRRKGKIIGTVMCGNDGRRAFIYHLAVAPEHRRRGIGAELVRLAMMEQKQRGMDKCALFILNDNISGKEFWMHMGFSYVEEAAAMAKTI